MEVTYRIGSPMQFSQEARERFLELLKEQAQVANPSMKKINLCPILCMAFDGDLGVAIGAIKAISKRAFVKAKVPYLAKEYNYELGYFYVSNPDKYRGRGIAKKMSANLLQTLGNKNIFATTEANATNSMWHILHKLGFKLAGDTYPGTKTGKAIGLYLLTASEK